MSYMRHMLAVMTLAAMLSACAGNGGGQPYGGNGPYGGAGAPTAAPKVTPAGTPLPTGNADVDNYGY